MLKKRVSDDAIALRESADGFGGASGTVDYRRLVIS